MLRRLAGRTMVAASLMGCVLTLNEGTTVRNWLVRSTSPWLVKSSARMTSTGTGEAVTDRGSARVPTTATVSSNSTPISTSRVTGRPGSTTTPARTAVLPAAGAQTAAVESAVRDATGLALPGVTVDARPAGGGDAHTAGDRRGRLVRDRGGCRRPCTTSRSTLPGFRTVVRGGVSVAEGTVAALEVEMAVQLEDRVVVGSRARPRSVTASAVPIDAIPPSRTSSPRATTDIADQLRTLVPSWKRQPATPWCS